MCATVNLDGMPNASIPKRLANLTIGKHKSWEKCEKLIGNFSENGRKRQKRIEIFRIFRIFIEMAYEILDARLDHFFSYLNS